MSPDQVDALPLDSYHRLPLIAALADEVERDMREREARRRA